MIVRLIQRHRLVELLRHATTYPLTIVQAPSGYGKTVAVEQFARSTANAVMFVDTTQPELVLPDDEQPTLLVLEGLHDAGEAFMDQVRLLVVDLPPHLHLLVTTRRGLPLPVARWRLQGLVAEVGVDNLRFRADEAAALFAGLAATPPDAAEVRRVTARTEGWAAALLLFADSPERPLSGRDPDPAASAALLDAVLAGQPDDLVDFLLTTSILFSFTGALCQAVTGTADAGLVIERVRAANLLLIPLDDRHEWFRYQRLFGELLRARLVAQRGEDHVRDLHRKAAAWLREHGGQDAVGHLAAAGDGDTALRMLAADVNLVFHEGRSEGMDWGRVFPADWVARDPIRMVYVAMVLIRSGWSEHAGVWLDEAERALQAEPGDAVGRALLDATRSLWHGINGDVDDAVRLSARALELMDDPSASPVGRRALVTLAFSYLQRGQLDEAEEVCAVLDDPRSPDVARGLMVPAFRAMIAERRGQLTEAETLARSALRTVELFDLPFHAATPEAHGALAAALCERGALDEAERHAIATIDAYSGRGWPVMAALHQVGLARIRAARRGPERGLDILDEISVPRPTTVELAVRPLEAQLRIAADHLDRAAELLEGMRPGPGRDLLRAELAMARGDAHAAEEAIAAVDGVDVRSRLMVELIAARIAAARHDPAGRDQHLLAAAKLGVSEGFCLVFVARAPELIDPLRVLAKRRGRLAPLLVAIDGLLATCAASLCADQQLSPRELGVLRYLPSELTNREIASELEITANTLKTHLRSLYRKLNVSSRPAAVAAARAGGLLRRA